MADHNKKRNNSFRKLFPSLFFSNKSKEKISDKDGHSNLKNTWETTPKNNRYENPRCIKLDNNQETDDSNVYENLTTAHRFRNDNDVISSSNHSSNSTLVSESAKNINYKAYPLPKTEISRNDVDYNPNYTARPQVPPKPYNEIIHSTPNQNKMTNSREPRYPDVYYHSIEKLRDNILPLNELEIYKASQIQAAPAPVGAEIKKVSTKFLISPKKEAEVRTIQPTRARSLSLDKNGEKLNYNENQIKKVQHKKSYNYSAPTSPIPTTHKIPNMPKTVSPYEHVRKNMMETEEKRNSLSRPNTRNKLTPSPITSDVYERTHSPVRINQKEYTKLSDTQKESARKKVEAFYWQKLKELKQKEDEYYLTQSVYSSIRSPVKSISQSNSNRSTPNSLIVAETRSCSLPRGTDSGYAVSNPNYANSPFVRRAPERRTDTFIQTNYSRTDHDVILRYPEKINLLNTEPVYVQNNKQIPLYHRGSLPKDFTANSQNKRVSFEDHSSHDSTKRVIVEGNYIQLNHRKEDRISNAGSIYDSAKGTSRTPPLPPVRTTSYGSASKNFKVTNKKTFQVPRGSHLIYSESESGSEAGEIQRIMQSISRKEEDWHGDLRGDVGLSDGETRVPSRGRPSRRDDPRRHTLGGGNHPYTPSHHPEISTIEMQYEKGHLRTPEYATVAKNREMRQCRVLDPRLRKTLTRGYGPQSNTMLFDDDPGIMSEVETSSTGFRRGGKQRSSLPVVRTPSKTLERPLGLVFLQYRSETKRALLPNEITSLDTVKALFVRSFPAQLSMPYMDSPIVKIYILDGKKDMFYELEDSRSNLRDIRDGSVLRLFEASDLGGGSFPGTVGAATLPRPLGAPMVRSCRATIDPMASTWI